MVTEQSTADKQMIDEGLRALKRGDCLSLVVGTDAAGQRKLHACKIRTGLLPAGHKTHHCGCGCGESWRYLTADNFWNGVGSLKDLVFS